eukprot:CAMPEP_0201587096 /NCGR_PEP_ID=MMETSP0190_2-20130828/139903_1 /ASSEMBLY_ACC=CAM_ASM_000263 /TAXON_ID=37353 /ORGANISM="Rosalina sp." /LENGTH=44 /DNA_ID= /DNA_START= /DNA_END= /DNA_ORIENTATION=
MTNIYLGFHVLVGIQSLNKENGTKDVMKVNMKTMDFIQHKEPER